MFSPFGSGSYRVLKWFDWQVLTQKNNNKMSITNIDLTVDVSSLIQV